MARTWRVRSGGGGAPLGVAQRLGVRRLVGALAYRRRVCVVSLRFLIKRRQAGRGRKRRQVGALQGVDQPQEHSDQVDVPSPTLSATTR